MVRIEIIADQAVEDDIREALREYKAAKHFTKIPVVYGEGNTEPKYGDHIWPEENFIIIVYCEDDEAARVKAAIAKVKEHFPQEGIKLFEMRDQS
ncbi:MAG: hypothetical protein LBQ61_05490 [Spirochaetales bacterium]|jgi:nitrogen regulatory protein PII|nr:hypothetical protein [Spirochaetales bacterium]